MTQKVLILGATGMLGHTLFRDHMEAPGLDVYGTLRPGQDGTRWFDARQQARLIADVDGFRPETVQAAIRRLQPDVVINCIGLIKQVEDAADPAKAIAINALLPHLLSGYCHAAGARLIHISTDCVYRGDRGLYRELDPGDAVDLYGQTKYLGEVKESQALTLRTSMIGHELHTYRSLLEWFLRQKGNVPGYTRARFSGLPTIELSRVIRTFVLPRPQMQGLYHLSAEPIDKCSLLQLVSRYYRKPVDIIPDETVQLDRSLDASRFRQETGYIPDGWPELIERMAEDYHRSPIYHRGERNYDLPAR